jgi:Tol biopolymer transport system component
VGTGNQTGFLLNPRLSPDDRRVAVEQAFQGNKDIWLLDGTRTSRFTFNAFNEQFPLWSPDGNRVVFARAGRDLFQRQANGAGPEEILFESQQNIGPQDWSSDGRYVLYGVNDPKTGQDLWVLPVEGDRPATGSGRPQPAEGRKPFAFLNSSFSERLSQFSPDVRWVAYQSDESGRNEIYVRPFPGPGGQWQVSTAGGIAPQWRKDGRELYYIAPDGKLMATSIVAKAAALEPGIPVPLFQTQIVYGGASPVGVGRQYDVASDGRFLINVTTDDGSTSPITVIQNWKPGN